MHIGIVSPCDFGAFEEYLDNESKNKIIPNKGCAPAVTTLTLALLKAGHKVSIFSNHKIKNEIYLHGECLNIYITKAYDKYPWKYLHGGWFDIHNLKKIIKKNINDVEILHAHWTYEFAKAAGKFVKIVPVVCTIRDWAPIIWGMESLKNKTYWTFRVLLNKKVFLNRTIKFIANSPYIESKVDKTKISLIATIPNPIKSNFIIYTKTENNESFNIVSISQSYDKKKNILKLLLAFQLFRRNNSKVKLQLVGKPFISDNQDMIKLNNRGLLNGVELIGSVNHDEVFKILDNASLMVHPSLEESFGNTLLEAMARRVAIIGGENSGAVPYVLDNGKCGCLTNIESVNDISDSMQKVFDDKNYRKLIVNNATNILTSRYSDTIVMQKHVEVYTEQIKNYLHV